MCDCCNSDRICAGHYRYFDPRCLFCGGRLLARIGKVRALPSEIAQRRRVVLADWKSAGHSESELRELAKAPESLEPIKKEPADGKHKR